jgi:O-antigen ligase
MERAWQGGLDLAMALLGFFVLFSTAGTAIALFLLLLLSLAAPRRLWRTRFWREPVLAAGLMLMAYIALRTFAGDGIHKASLAAANHYHELLVAPVLWALLRNAQRPRVFLVALFAGALFLGSLYWFAPLNDKLEWFLHTRRISAGFGLAVCAFLLFEQARFGLIRPLVGYSLAAYLAVTLLFANDGRTGQVLLLLLVVCAAFRAAPRRWRMASVFGVVVTAVLLAASSNAVRVRMAETALELRTAESSASGVPRSRVELLRNGWTVVEQHWLLGTGWGSYPQALNEVALARDRKALEASGELSVNPHNEYVLQLGAGGLPALLLFVAWLLIPLVVGTRRGASPWNGAMACIALAFALDAAFNSVLLDFTEAHVYAALLAWLLAQPRQA